MSNGPFRWPLIKASFTVIKGNYFWDFRKWRLKGSGWPLNAGLIQVRLYVSMGIKGGITGVRKTEVGDKYGWQKIIEAGLQVSC